MSLFSELKRRNVFRVGAAYIVTAWLVIQVVETIFPAFGFGDAAVRFVTIAFAVGLVPVLVVTWVFELTPEGLRRDAGIEPGAPATLQAARRLDRMILVVLAVALAYFAFDKFVLAPGKVTTQIEKARLEGRTEALVESFGDQSVAVLPFANMSPDPEQEYFADGLAEEVLNLLAGIPELRVISRSSSFSFKGRDLEIPDIAEQLGVAYILEGSVRKSGNRIRVTAQLIQARSDSHLWSQNWDRTLDDVFAIQDEIAAEVVDRLQLTLIDPMPTSLRTDPEVYMLTLQASQLLEYIEPDKVEQAASLIAQALAIDPDYVPALEQQIGVDYLRKRAGLITEAQEERLWQAMRDRILALDPDNGVVHSYLAWDYYNVDRNIEAAASEYQRLVAREPNNAEVLRVAGGFLRRTGKFEPALKVLNRCVRVDPLKLGCMWQLKEAYLWSGNLEQAEQVSARFNAFWGRDSGGHDVLTRLLLGDPAGAKSLMAGWKEDTDGIHALTARAEHDLGNVAAFESAMAHLLGQDAEQSPHVYETLAQVYAYIGQPDDAFEWLDRAFEHDEPGLFKEAFHPGYWNLHGDPRWDAHRERLGLSAERLDAIEFEVKLPD